jgi:hypothetical protein
LKLKSPFRIREYRQVELGVAGLVWLWAVLVSVQIFGIRRNPRP